MSELCAAGRRCGTPYGWRSGGRCPACRAAHNAETRRYRGITGGERGLVLSLLRSGKTAGEAAEAIGRSSASLSQAARHDSELRAALDGLPLEQQVAARKGDFLAALARTGGSRGAAARELGLTRGTTSSWRRDPAYAAAEDAVVRWVTGADVRPRRRVTTEVLDRAAELMEQGHSMSAAAQEVGMSVTTLRTYQDRHEGLGRVMPPRQGPRVSWLTSEREGEFRELWADRGLLVRDIAERMGVAEVTVLKWARRLGLPRRRGPRLGG